MSPSLVLLKAMVERAEERKRISNRVVSEIESYLSTPLRDAASNAAIDERQSLSELLQSLKVA
jgi:hypothetical protein